MVQQRLAVYMKSLRLPIALILTFPLVSAQISLPDDAPKPLRPEQSATVFKLPKGFRMENCCGRGMARESISS